MPNRPPTYRPLAARPKPPDSRPTSAERGYGSRWQRYRLSFLAEHPLCERCRAEDRVTEATVVDHVIPHKGDEGRFWDEKNHQSLCDHCHNLKTATTDGGFGRLPTNRPPQE